MEAGGPVLAAVASGAHDSREAGGVAARADSHEAIIGRPATPGASVRTRTSPMRVRGRRRPPDLDVATGRLDENLKEQINLLAYARVLCPGDSQMPRPGGRRKVNDEVASGGAHGGGASSGVERGGAATRRAAGKPHSGCAVARGASRSPGDIPRIRPESDGRHRIG